MNRMPIDSQRSALLPSWLRRSGWPGSRSGLAHGAGLAARPFARSAGGAGLAAVAAALALGAPASAAYVMSLSSGGMDSLTLAPGDSFTLDVVLTSDSGDMNNSAIFRLEFSSPGLLYTGYEWASPYETGGLFDDSKPFVTDLPVLLSADTLGGVGYPEGVVDVELSNAALSPFAEGVLVTLELAIPLDWRGPSLMSILATPDTIAFGFDVIPTTAGGAFTLEIIPAPSAVALLGLWATGGGSRRRRR